MGHPLNSRRAGVPPFRGMQVSVPVRVEPKVFFANERTFLSWLHFCILLTSLSITLVNFGDRVGRICGLALTSTSIIAMLYSIYQFLTRSRNIRKRAAGPYYDRLGPVLLSMTLSFALVMNLFLKWHEIATSL